LSKKGLPFHVRKTYNINIKNINSQNKKEIIECQVEMELDH